MRKKNCAAIALATVLWLMPEVFAEAGKKLNVTEIPFNRTLPHAFYDQAVASIAGIYTSGQVLMAERLGYIGDFVYALVAYRKEANDPQAYLDVVAVSGTRAWRLQGTFPADKIHRIHTVALDRIQQLR